MSLQQIKLQVIDILGTHDTYVSDCFSSSHVLSEGETFKSAVEEDVASLIEENGFEGCVEDIEWFNNNTTASIRFDENEYTVVYSLTTQYVTINID